LYGGTPRLVIIQRISIVLGLLLLASCANTQKVWDKHEPNEYLQVQGPSSIEEEIKAKGVDYFCENIVYSTEGHEKVCYVEMSSAEKVKEWKIRLVKTSFAVAKDVAKNVALVVRVVGYVVLMELFSSGDGSGEGSHRSMPFRADNPTRLLKRAPVNFSFDL